MKAVDRERGKRFAELLKKHGYTVSTFAKKIGVTEDAVRKWRRGERVPRQEHLKKVLQVLNVTSDYLLYGVSDTTEKEPFPGFKKIMNLPFDQRFDAIIEVAQEQTGCPLAVFDPAVKKKYENGEMSEKEVYESVKKQMEEVKESLKERLKVSSNQI